MIAKYEKIICIIIFCCQKIIYLNNIYKYLKINEKNK